MVQDVGSFFEVRSTDRWLYCCCSELCLLVHKVPCTCSTSSSSDMLHHFRLKNKQIGGLFDKSPALPCTVFWRNMLKFAEKERKRGILGPKRAKIGRFWWKMGNIWGFEEDLGLIWGPQRRCKNMCIMHAWFSAGPAHSIDAMEWPMRWGKTRQIQGKTKKTRATFIHISEIN